jgi:hypothetical protein
MAADISVSPVNKGTANEAAAVVGGTGDTVPTPWGDAGGRRNTWRAKTMSNHPNRASLMTVKSFCTQGGDNHKDNT